MENNAMTSESRGVESKLGQRWTRELIVFVPVYFFLSLINLHLKLFLTLSWVDGTLVRNHNALMQFNYYNHEQSRLLQYLIPELFRRLFSLSIVNAYVLQRWIFIFLVFVCFHFYLRKWFGVAGSFAGVSFLAAILPFSYLDDLQESSPLLFLTFLLALWAIREHKTIALLIVFFVGGLNNETMAMLPLVYFLYNYKTSKFRDLFVLCRDTFLVSLPLILTIGPIRYVTRDRPVLGGGWHLPDNLENLARQLQTSPLDYYASGYLYTFFIFGAFWIYAFLKFKDNPVFLRRASLLIPIFLVVHMLFSIMDEVRHMIPLAFIIIPMVFFYLFALDPTRRDSILVSEQASERAADQKLTTGNS